MKMILSIYLITVGLLISFGASSAKSQINLINDYTVITSSTK